jgi:drug/metabolite transporter (DMT)-like permease
MQDAALATPPRPSRGAIFLAYGVVYFVWGSTYLGMRMAVETMPPFGMAGARFVIAGVLLYGWRRLRGEAGPGRRDWAAALLTGGLLCLGGNGLVSWALQHGLPSGTAALLVATTPLWIALVDWARPGGVRPTVIGIAGLLLGFAGAGLLVGPDALKGGTGAANPIYAGAIVAAALSWALGSVYLSRRKAIASPAMGSGMQMLCGGVLLMLASVANGEAQGFRPSAVTGHSLAGFAYLIVFGSLIAFSTYGWLLKVEPPSRVATYAYVNPVVAVLLGWWLAAERVTTLTFVAAAVIVAGVVLITTSRQVKRPAAPDVEDPKRAPRGESAKQAAK